MVFQLVGRIVLLEHSEARGEAETAEEDAEAAKGVEPSCQTSVGSRA
jgi:hypothetical protein